MGTNNRLEKILRPKSIAIVGASEKPGSLGGGILDNLIRFNYDGDVFLINPKRSDIGGRVCYPSIEDLPKAVDCALLAVPRQFIPDTMRSCASVGVGSAIIIAGGFAEQDAEGQRLQDEIIQIAGAAQMPVLGPNCLGAVNYVDRTPLLFGATKAPVRKVTSGVAVISQSGAMAAVLRVAFQARGIDLTYGVSTGNEAVTGVEDVLEFLIANETSPVVAVLAEQIRDPQRFIQLAKDIRNAGQKLVLLHLGRSAAGQEAAKSHTGALSGDHAVLSAVLTQLGVILVDGLEALIDVSEFIFRFGDVPVGRAAVITESGAFRGMVLDYCDALGLDVPTFSENTCEALTAILPPIAQAENPLDLTAQALIDPDLYGNVLDCVSGDPGVDSAILTVMLPSVESADRKLPQIIKALSKHKKIPVIFAMLGEQSPIPQHYIDQLRELGVPFMRSPERVLRALSCMAQAEKEVEYVEPVAPAVAAEPLAPGMIPEYRSRAILEKFGLPFGPGKLATNLDEAVAAASTLGYPVALKIQAADIPHKSDVGGVHLNVADEPSLIKSWERLTADVAAACPGVGTDGVFVEPMNKGGVELILGLRHDPDWGPVLLIGLGGVMAELLKDVAIVPANASPEKMEQAIRSLKGAPLLEGYRGSEPCDIDALVSAMGALGRVIATHPEISELDINPFMARAAGQGAVGLDALILVT